MLFHSKNVKSQIKESVMGKGLPWSLDSLTQKLKIAQTLEHEVKKSLIFQES